MADLNAYWQELSTKYGLSADDAAAVAKILGTEAGKKAFSEGFVQTPDHHRTMDITVTPLKQKVQQYDDWYKNTAKPVSDRYAAGLQKLEQYQATYGELDLSVPGDRRAAAAATGLTREDLEKLLESERAINNKVTKTYTKAAAYHLHKFNEVLDPDEFEKMAIPLIQQGKDPWDAYKVYVQPKEDVLKAAADKKKEEEIEARITRQTDERVRDALSKHHLPIEVSKQPTMLEIRDRTEADKVRGPAQEQAAADEFFKGWNEATAKSA